MCMMQLNHWGTLWGAQNCRSFLILPGGLFYNPEIMKKRYILVLLLTFFAVTLFIDFFHTEQFLQVKESCPACHFQSSIPNLGQHELCSYLHPPQLRLLELLPVDECSEFQQILLDHPTSRAPPLV